MAAFRRSQFVKYNFPEAGRGMNKLKKIGMVLSSAAFALGILNFAIRIFANSYSPLAAPILVLTGVIFCACLVYYFYGSTGGKTENDREKDEENAETENSEKADSDDEENRLDE